MQTRKKLNKSEIENIIPSSFVLFSLATNYECFDCVIDNDGQLSNKLNTSVNAVMF